MSEDDDILKQLGARLREQRAEEGEDLRAGARPLDEAAVERIAARVLGGPSRPRDEAPAAASGRVLPFRRLAYAAAPLAAAAAVALFVMSRSSAGGLPGYDVAIVSAADVRGPEAKPAAGAELDPDGDFELVARPAQPVPGVAARAALVRGEQALPFGGSVEVSTEGAVRLTGRSRDVFPTVDAPYTVVVVVAPRESALPGARELERIAVDERADAASLRVLRAPIRFVRK